MTIAQVSYHVTVSVHAAAATNCVASVILPGVFVLSFYRVASASHYYTTHVRIKPPPQLSARTYNIGAFDVRNSELSVTHAQFAHKSLTAVQRAHRPTIASQPQHPNWNSIDELYKCRRDRTRRRDKSEVSTSTTSRQQWTGDLGPERRVQLVIHRDIRAIFKIGIEKNATVKVRRCASGKRNRPRGRVINHRGSLIDKACSFG